MFDPRAAVAGPFFVTDKSAVGASVTVAVVVDELLLLSGSPVDALTVAVLAMLLPFGAVFETCRTSVMLAVALNGKLANVHDTLAGPGVQLPAGPLVGVAEPNVVFAGYVSLTTTFAASVGPLL